MGKWQGGFYLTDPWYSTKMWRHCVGETSGASVPDYAASGHVAGQHRAAVAGTLGGERRVEHAQFGPQALCLGARDRKTLQEEWVEHLRKGEGEMGQ